MGTVHNAPACRRSLQVVEVTIKFLVGMLRERVGRILDHLVDVGVFPRHALEAALLAPHGSQNPPVTFMSFSAPPTPLPAPP